MKIITGRKIAGLSACTVAAAVLFTGPVQRVVPRSVAASSNQALRLSVDGATEPESIPDDVAMMLFVRTLTKEQPENPRHQSHRIAYAEKVFTTAERLAGTFHKPRTPDDVQQRRAQARLRTDRLLKLLSDHKSEIDALRPAGVEDRQRYEAERAVALRKLREDAVKYLGVEDARLLDVFVNKSVKRQIRGYSR